MRRLLTALTLVVASAGTAAAEPIDLDGVKAEISVKLGYPIKTGSDITVMVGNDTFTLFPKEERAYVADATEELKLIEAMKKGSKLTVQATSERGTATTDTYSLAGLSQALQALAAACP